MKKLILFIALISIMGLSWAYDFSAVAPSGQTLYYNIIGGNAKVTYQTLASPSYSNLTGTLEIPASVIYEGTTYTVTGIESRAFYGCIGLTSVSIPNSVTDIGSRSFYGCSNLQSVVIPNSVTTIEVRAFYGCSGLQSVSLPNSITHIGNETFSRCSGITTLTLPSSVTYIGEAAFSGCSGVVSISVESGNANYDSRYNCNAIIETSNNKLIIGCSNTTIPSSITSIGDYAFYLCSALTSITIPESVTSIGAGAFSGCSGLTNLLLGGSVSSIGNFAFEHCSSLATVNIPNSTTTIGTDAFSYCTNLQSISIPNTVTFIGGNAFWGCSQLTSVTIPNSITSVESEVFGNCSSLANVIIPNSVTTIGWSTFQGCSNLTSLVIPESVSSIGNSAFDGCSNLTIINLSDLTFSKTKYGTVKRVVKCNNHGEGENTIHQIPSSFSVVASEDGNEYHIPTSLIQSNYIYYDNGAWKAKNIVLTDGRDAFNTPVEFTAEEATYTRNFTNGNRSTLYLPFTIDVPANFEVFEFADFDGQKLLFSPLAGGSPIQAYHPYVVGCDLAKTTTACTFSKSNAVFPATPAPGTDANIVTHGEMTFNGVVTRTHMSDASHYGYQNGYFVQSGGEAYVNPFRCFFKASGMGNPSILGAEFSDEPLGINEVDGSNMRQIRYSNDVYDLMGRVVRKNAESLRGLPRGIYIWRGKKVVSFE